MRASLLPLLLPVAMSACAQTPGPREPTPPSSAGAASSEVTPERLTREGAWALREASGGENGLRALTAPGVAIKLQFVDRLTVFGGCNQLSADYRIEAGRLLAGPVSSTRMACEPVPQEADMTMKRLLEQPLEARMEEGQLVLRAASGEVLRLDPVPLTQ